MFCAIFGLLILKVVGGDQSALGLRISPFSASVNQPSHQQFVLTCKGFGAEPNLFSDLKWFDSRDQEITPTYSERINPDLRVEELELGAILLHFLNPVPDNSGHYRCLATFQHSDIFEKKVFLNFFQDVQWEDCPREQSLVLGLTNERIRCKASANPKPNIVWSKNDKPLDDNNRYRIDSNGVTIDTAVGHQDGGVFRVRALVTETGRLHDTFINVQIFVRPQIMDIPDHFEGTEGEETTLKCSAKGVPEPLITWLDPNKRNLSHVGGYSVDRNGGALIITRVRRPEDSGQFTCIAENTAGSDQKLTILRVYRKPKITSFANSSSEEGKQSVLECRALGEPKPRISVRKDGQNRELLVGDPRVTFEDLQETEETVLRLRLAPTRRLDDGLYFCRAENRGGVVERVGHLEVRFPPDLSRTPTTSVKHWTQQPINVTCIADAIPNATIRWFFGQSERILDSHWLRVDEKTTGTSVLTLFPNKLPQGLDIDRQPIKCEAENPMGVNYTFIRLVRASVPGQLTVGLSDVINRTSSSVVFRLSSPRFDGGMPVIAVHTNWRRDMDNWDLVSDPKTGQWEASIQNKNSYRFWPVDRRGFYLVDKLRPNTRYWFRFAAQNDVGFGDWSAVVEVWTARESRPEKPAFHNLPILDIDHYPSPFKDQFQVTWTMPEDNGRPIRFFELRYTPVRRSDFNWQPIGESLLKSVSMTDQSVTSLTLKHLNSNTFYELEIRANNDKGFSDPETVVFRTADTSVDDTETTHDDRITDQFRTSSIGWITGVAIAAIVILLLLMDVFFFYRYKVGAIFFLSQHVFNGNDSETTANVQKTTSDDRRDDRISHSAPAFGRRAANRTSVDNPAFESQHADNVPFIGHRPAPPPRPTQRSRDSAV